MTPIDQDEGERLRRQLRAMSAVNEQQRAQLDAAQAESRSAPRQDRVVDPIADPARALPVGLAARRATIADGWLDRLPAPPAGARAELLVDPDGGLVLREGGTRRRLRSGLLAAAVEALVGERRPVTDQELHALTEGAPVEVLEGGSGLPFVVIEGRRLPVRGLPLPFPVDQLAVDAIAVGPELDLPAASTPRRAHEADGWIVAASTATTSDAPPRLVTAPDASMFVIEGPVRRAVRSGLVIPALEALLGAAQPIDADTLAALEDGPAVEILEAPVGPPFIVLGGKRTAVYGHPPAYPVHQARADALPDGPSIDLAEAHRVARRTLERELTDEANRARSEQARAERKLERVQAQLDDARRREAARVAEWEANPDPAGELRRLVARRGGVVPMVAAVAKKRVRRLVRRTPR